jgi:hypothetical protein
MEFHNLGICPSDGEIPELGATTQTSFCIGQVNRAVYDLILIKMKTEEKVQHSITM